MDISLTNLNDLAYKILHEDLCKSYDIVNAHMDVLKTIDCNGRTFLVAVFCKAIDEGDIAFFQQHVPYVWSANFTERIDIITHAVKHHMSLEHIQRLMEYDFHSTDGSTQKPMDNFAVFFNVGDICASHERWDVVNWMLSNLKDNDVECLFLGCHFSHPHAYKYIQTTLNPITLMWLGEDPNSRIALCLPRSTCANIVQHALCTMQCAIDENLQKNQQILYKLCMFVHHQHTQKIVNELNKKCVTDAIKDPKNLIVVYDILQLMLLNNMVHAANIVLKLIVRKNPFLPTSVVRHMIWCNMSGYISPKYVSKYVATSVFPFAVAANCKEVGAMLLTIGVDQSTPIDWDCIQKYQDEIHFTRKDAGHIQQWPIRLQQWVNDHEKSVLEIALDGVEGCDTPRKI